MTCAVFHCLALTDRAPLVSLNMSLGPLSCELEAQSTGLREVSSLSVSLSLFLGQDYLTGGASPTARYRCLIVFFCFLVFFLRERETWIYCSSYSCIPRLVLVCVLTGDRTHEPTPGCMGVRLSRTELPGQGPGFFLSMMQAAQCDTPGASYSQGRKMVLF